MKILLVDDDDALLSFLAKDLENRRCEVHRSSSGDDALHVWQRGQDEFVLEVDGIASPAAGRDGDPVHNLAGRLVAHAFTPSRRRRVAVGFNGLSLGIPDKLVGRS
jgi:CheY-like chemotaxis protein